MRQLVLLATLVLAAGQTAAAQDWVVSWDWKMPYRVRSAYALPPFSDFNYNKPIDLRPTGVDTDGDGLTDCFAFGQGCDAELTTITDGINPPEGWKVEFTVTDRDGPLGLHTYAWEIPGGIPVTFDPATRTGYAYFPREGRYRVTLTVTAAAVTMTSAQEVVVQDWLIVAMGDSYISGEGNPDLDGDAFDGLRAPVWADRRCHRSTYSWPALVASWLEDADWHSSVTLVHLACGGSKVSEGMYGDYDGTEVASPPIPPQLEQVRTLAGDREIDALLLSAGGNDIGFGDIVKSCIFQGDCHTENATLLFERDPFCDAFLGPLGLADLCKATMPAIGQSPSAKQLFDGLYFGTEAWDGTGKPDDKASLDNKYAYLGPAIGELNLLDPAGVYMLDYPAATNDETGAVCGWDSRPFDMIPGFVTTEASWASSYAQGFLKQSVRQLVSDNGWSLIGFGDLFNTHGYCANPELPEPGGAGAWFVRLPASLIREVAMEGTLHPNYRAHYEIAGALESTLRSHFWNDGLPDHGVRRLPTQPGVVIDIDASYVVDEGDSLALRNGSFNYDGSEPAFMWYLDGGCADSGAASLDAQAVRSPVLTALDDCTGWVEVAVTDDPGKPVRRVPLTVRNVDPAFVKLEVNKTIEGGTATLTFEFKDAGTLDTHAAWLDWGDGTTEAFAGKAIPGTQLTATHLYVDNGLYNVGVSIDDGDGGTIKQWTPTEVANVPPVAGAIAGLASGYLVNTVVAVSAPFTDAGVIDTHAARWDWGDGTFTDATVTEAHGSGTAAGTHAYSQAGMYAVRLSVSDKDGATAWAAPATAIVFDPAGGEVSGAGLLALPASAPPVFAFSLKYRGGNVAPSGRFQFEAPAQRLRLAASAFDWLVVDGASVWFAGSGALNRTPGYRFLVSALDGGRLTPPGPDRVRVKILGPTGEVVFDNEPGLPDLVPPTLAIASGTVVVR